MYTKILLTGRPGCGKTTLIRKVISRFPGPMAGFYTQEIRFAGVRAGFELLTLDGQRAVMAHVDIRSSHRVGKYGVYIGVLDELAVPALYQGLDENGLLIIDEIGPMEILSHHFRQAVMDVLQSPVRVLGSIVRRSIPFTDAIKSRPNIELIDVRLDNREQLVTDLIDGFTAGNNVLS